MRPLAFVITAFLVLCEPLNGQSVGSPLKLVQNTHTEYPLNAGDAHRRTEQPKKDKQHPQQQQQQKLTDGVPKKHQMRLSNKLKNAEQHPSSIPHHLPFPPPQPEFEYPKELHPFFDPSEEHPSQAAAQPAPEEREAELISDSSAFPDAHHEAENVAENVASRRRTGGVSPATGRAQAHPDSGPTGPSRQPSAHKNAQPNPQPVYKTEPALAFGQVTVERQAVPQPLQQYPPMYVNQLQLQGSPIQYQQQPQQYYMLQQQPTSYFQQIPLQQTPFYNVPQQPGSIYYNPLVQYSQPSQQQQVAQYPFQQPNYPQYFQPSVQYQPQPQVLAIAQPALPPPPAALPQPALPPPPPPPQRFSYIAVPTTVASPPQISIGPSTPSSPLSSTLATALPDYPTVPTFNKTPIATREAPLFNGTPVEPFVLHPIGPRAPPPPDRFVPFESDIFEGLEPPEKPKPLPPKEKIPTEAFQVDTKPFAVEKAIDTTTSAPTRSATRKRASVRVNSNAFVSSTPFAITTRVGRPHSFSAQPRPTRPPPQFSRTVAQPTRFVSTTQRPRQFTTSKPFVSAMPREETNISRVPSDVFLQCCRRKNVAPGCESRCNFEILNKKVLTGMFLGTDPCPQRHGRDLLSCAAQESDHTHCCRAKGVTRTSAKEKCLGFCNLAPGTTFQADISLLPCWAVLNDIKQCFKDGIVAGHPTKRTH